MFNNDRTTTQELLKKAGFLQGVFDAMPASVFVVDSDIRIFNVNTAATRMFDMDRDAFISKKGGEALHCVNALSAAGGCGKSAHCSDCIIRNSVRQASQGLNVFRIPTAMRAQKHGQIEEEQFMITASAISYDKESFIILTLEDVTELKKTQKELEQTANKLNIITSVLGEGVYVLDAGGALTFMNPEAERLLGWTEKELLGKNIHEVIHFQRADGTPLPASECPVFKSISSNACYRVAEDVFTRKDGELVPIALVSTPICDDGKVKGSVAAFHDISERKRVQEALKNANLLLERQATTDILTGVFNRLKFNDLLDAELQRAVRQGLPLSVIMFDIDHFKRINDTFGHHAGDSVLKELTCIVRDTLRKYDSLARWGGEEFVVLSPGNTLENTRLLAERIRHNIEKHSFAGMGVVTSSFGVSAFAEGDDADALLQRVDGALYKAKNSGRNRVEAAFCPAE
ncbi:MAG: sensor domain-containing diguanylate cyclase [Nitrospirae bacterium]|nr:MAG: sensor domain-containing diguanylate cyclase [Nitrospirota bacterium]